MVLQEPGDRLIACSASRKSSLVMAPALIASLILPEGGAGSRPARRGTSH